MQKKCKRCKLLFASSDFPITKKGKPSVMCSSCYEYMQKNNAADYAKFKTSRASLSPDSGMCHRCRHVFPKEEFTADPNTRLPYHQKPSLFCFKCRDYNKEHAIKLRKRWSKEQYVKVRTKAVQRNRELRAETFAAYGSKCACCGENEPDFLELDHVENDGKHHRKTIGQGPGPLAYWAKQNGYPNSIQLLCANCHASKTFHGGICVHKQKEAGFDRDSYVLSWPDSKPRKAMTGKSATL